LAVIYFAMNYLLLGSVFLSIGAQASTAREVQILSMPATIAQVLIFGFAAFAVGAPNSDYRAGRRVFPLSSPLVMLARGRDGRSFGRTCWQSLLWQALWVGLIVACRRGCSAGRCSSPALAPILVEAGSVDEKAVPAHLVR
jgi:ABC-2 type transport system permease protein